MNYTDVGKGVLARKRQENCNRNERARTLRKNTSLLVPNLKGNGEKKAAL